jgi:hypothetical protein
MWRVNGHNKQAVTTVQNIQIIGLVWEGGLLRTKNMTSHKVTVFSVRFLFEARKGTIVRRQSV